MFHSPSPHKYQPVCYPLLPPQLPTFLLYLKDLQKSSGTWYYLRSRALLAEEETSTSFFESGCVTTIGVTIREVSPLVILPTKIFAGSLRFDGSLEGSVEIRSATARFAKDASSVNGSG
jgi:hypothetical protein